jgi:hypothetical protein
MSVQLWPKNTEICSCSARAAKFVNGRNPGGLVEKISWPAAM